MLLEKILKMKKIGALFEVATKAKVEIKYLNIQILIRETYNNIKKCKELVFSIYLK